MKPVWTESELTHSPHPARPSSPVHDNAVARCFSSSYIRPLTISTSLNETIITKRRSRHRFIGKNELRASKKVKRSTKKKKNIEPAAAIVIFIIGLIITVALGWTPFEAAALNMDGLNPLGIRLTQQTVTVGNITILEIVIQDHRPPIDNLRARFQDVVIPLFDHPAEGETSHIGLIPVPYKSRPGVKNISIEWVDSTGHHHQPIPIQILRGHFQSEILQVSPSRVIPPNKELKRIERERGEIKAAYSHSQSVRLWNETFQRPTTGKVTSPYGTQRLLNGQLHRYHGGVDFRAPTGTPIHAANMGIVRLAKNLYYSGNHVILDHGKGLFTSYSHLNRIDVHTGQSIKKGQVIGQSGATGRVTGPHLHWSVKIHGVNVDPLGFLEALGTLFNNQHPSIHSVPQSSAIR